jgi:hypothetical protein
MKYKMIAVIQTMLSVSSIGLYMSGAKISLLSVVLANVLAILWCWAWALAMLAGMRLRRAAALHFVGRKPQEEGQS